MPYKDKEKRQQNSKRYQIINKEAIKEKRKQHYIENRDKIIKKVTAWRIKNIGRVKEKRKQHYIENRDKIQERRKRYLKENPNVPRDNWFRKKYKITLVQYNDMVAAQDFKCAICLTHQDMLSRRMAIDHCHKTGKNRGLLCVSCNLALGLFKDDIVTIQNTILYLQKYNLT